MVGIYRGQHDAGRREARAADGEAGTSEAGTTEAGTEKDALRATDLPSADERAPTDARDALVAVDLRGGDDSVVGDGAVTMDAAAFETAGGAADAGPDTEPQSTVDAAANNDDAAARTDGGGGGDGGAGGAGTAGSPDAASADLRAPPPEVPCAPAWHADNVEARLFSLPSNGQTACNIGSGDRPTLAAAVDDATFRNAVACGACLEVRGTFTGGVVTVRVVDRAGSNGGILLTRGAMDQVSPGGSSVRVDWRLAPCETGGRPVRYYVKEDSNSGYVGIQVRDARYPVTKMSAIGSSATLPLTLQSYNYWTSPTLGLGTVTLRITDINGQVLEDPGIVVRPRAETAGRGQFPRCR